MCGDEGDSFIRIWRAQTSLAQRNLRKDRIVDRKRDLDLVLADARILGALGLGLLAKPGPVAAQGAVQLRPILS